MYIKSKGNPCPGSLLLEEVPETPLDFWEATEAADAPASSGESNAALATRFPPDSIERKLAILRHHQPTCPRPSLRSGRTVAEESGGAHDPPVGGRWQARPISQPGKMHQALRGIEDQVNPGMRPSMDTIQKLFWAPGPEGSSQTTW